MSDFVPNPFGPFVVGHTVLIRYQVREQAAGADELGKDISASRWVYRLRAYATRDAAAVLVDEVISKSAAEDPEGTASYLDHDYYVGATPRDALIWSIVEVDTSNAVATSKSGYRERVLLRWKAAIEDAPVA